MARIVRKSLALMSPDDIFCIRTEEQIARSAVEATPAPNFNTIRHGSGQMPSSPWIRYRALRLLRGTGLPSQVAAASINTPGLPATLMIQPFR